MKLLWAQIVSEEIWNLILKNLVTTAKNQTRLKARNAEKITQDAKGNYFAIKFAKRNPTIKKRIPKIGL